MSTEVTIPAKINVDNGRKKSDFKLKKKLKILILFIPFRI